MLDFETFTREAWNLIGRKVAKRAWLAEVYAMAAESIGLPVLWNLPPSICFVFNCHATWI
jgi:hypothetical protein